MGKHNQSLFTTLQSDPEQTDILFSRYDRVRIVSLPSRKDRRREMRAELKKFGLLENSRIQFFDAIREEEAGLFRSPGSHGCYKSHLAILDDAAAARESVLILQDDCEFLPELSYYQMPAQVDVFYGGFSASSPDDPYDSDIIGAHFMGFSSTAAIKASAYLRALLDPNFPPDSRAAAMPSFNPVIRPPIDGACVWFRRAYPELRTEFKLLCNQRSSRSDITPGRVLDNVWGLRDLLGVARRVRRSHAPLFRRSRGTVYTSQGLKERTVRTSLGASD
jgi:glycosyl transferase family 25